MTITPPYPQQIAELDQQVLDGLLSPEDYGRSLPDFSYAIYAQGEWHEYNSFFAENPMRYLQEIAEDAGTTVNKLEAQVWAMAPHSATEFKLIRNGLSEVNLSDGLTKLGYLTNA